MAYSVDLGYKEYFKCAAEGKYDNGFLKDRAIVIGMAAGTIVYGALRTISRVVYLVIEIAKVVFYAFAAISGDVNRKRLISHCQLLGLNAAAFVAIPLQLAIHAVALLVGIISPKAAYRMMQVGTTPIAFITSHEKKIDQEYQTPEVYIKITDALKEKIANSINIPNPFGKKGVYSILDEFSEALNFGLVAPLGMMNKFHLFGTNPIRLTPEQWVLPPILLLHGNYSNPTTLLPLMHALEKAGNKRAVYTAYLPPNNILPDSVIETILHIKGRHPKPLDMVGYSMGSDCIQELLDINYFHILADLNARDVHMIQDAQKEKGYNPYLEKFSSPLKKCGRVITIGTPLYIDLEKLQNIKAFDIIGSRDRLAHSNKSKLEANQYKVINTGHLGLMFHPDSLQAMQDFLKA
jgi:hypothetical protein